MYEINKKGNRSKQESTAFACFSVFFHAGIRSYQKSMPEVLWDHERKA